MRPYLIREGDYLTKLGVQLRFDADRVWQQPKNGALREARDNPDMLAPGDVVFVPEAPPKPAAATTGTTNRYRAKVPRATVKVAFFDGDKPLAGEPYELTGLGARVLERTGPDGCVTFVAAVDVREVRIVFHERGLSYPVLIGDLDPVEVETGVNMRLAHLGYFGFALGAADQEPRTDAREPRSAAIAAFQVDAGLSPTGEVNDETRAALVEWHGS
jgi:hypothetical protein